MPATRAWDRCIGIGSRITDEFILAENCFNKVLRVAWSMDSAC
jgi:hypothetical protein